MPDKIYVSVGENNWCCSVVKGGTEYIHADKVNQIAREHEIMRKALECIAEAYNEHPEVYAKRRAKEALDKLDTKTPNADTLEAMREIENGETEPYEPFTPLEDKL